MTDVRGTEAPPGYVRHQPSSPFLDVVGPFWRYRDDGGSVHVGLMAEARHANSRGTVHGGLLTTMADIALGYAFIPTRDEGVHPPLTTGSLSIDFAGTARVGQWVEARAEVLRLGNRFAFSTCFVYADDNRIGRASGVFSVASSRNQTAEGES